MITRLATLSVHCIRPSLSVGKVKRKNLKIIIYSFLRIHFESAKLTQVFKNPNLSYTPRIPIQYKIVHFESVKKKHRTKGIPCISHSSLSFTLSFYFNSSPIILHMLISLLLPLFFSPPLFLLSIPPRSCKASSK